MPNNIELPVYGIVLTGAGVRSNLHAGGPGEYPEFNAAMDAIEAMVLAHQRAGVDVESPAYLVGLETAVEACIEQFSDDNTILVQLLEAQRMGFAVRPAPANPDKFGFIDPSGNISDVLFESEVAAWRRVVAELPDYWQDCAPAM